MSRSLGRELTVDDIDTSHPLQAKNGSKNPITIIKFVRRDLRNEILQRRRLLRRYRVNATEQLTDENINLYRSAQDFAGSNNVWAPHFFSELLRQEISFFWRFLLNYWTDLAQILTE